MDDNYIYLVTNDSYFIIAGPFATEKEARNWTASYHPPTKIQKFKLEETM